MLRINDALIGAGLGALIYYLISLLGPSCPAPTPSVPRMAIEVVGEEGIYEEERARAKANVARLLAQLPKEVEAEEPPRTVKGAQALPQSPR